MRAAWPTVDTAASEAVLWGIRLVAWPHRWRRLGRMATAVLALLFRHTWDTTADARTSASSSGCSSRTARGRKRALPRQRGQPCRHLRSQSRTRRTAGAPPPFRTSTMRARPDRGCAMLVLPMPAEGPRRGRRPAVASKSEPGCWWKHQPASCGCRPRGPSSASSSSSWQQRQIAVKSRRDRGLQGPSQPIRCVPVLSAG